MFFFTYRKLSVAKCMLSRRFFYGAQSDHGPIMVVLLYCSTKVVVLFEIVSCISFLLVSWSPDGTFKLTSVANSALSMYGNMSLEYHINVTIFFRKFVTLVSLNVPSGTLTV